MMWIHKATGASSNLSRTRLVDIRTEVAINNVDEMQSLAVQDRLGLCDFYGPSATNTSYVQPGSAAELIEPCKWLLVVDSSREAVVVNGYISPVIALLILITNSLICAVLLQSHMRTTTNIFLTALAVSDALTGVTPLPAFIYFYSFSAHRSILVPPSWCHLYQPMSLHLPTTWHTASIWLTVGLAFQRYIYICHQTVGKRLCTVRNAVITVLAIYAAAIVSQLFRNFENRYGLISLSVPLGVEDSATERINITGCYVEPLLAEYHEFYLSTYWYFRIIFIHVIPCILLVGLNARLFVAMRHAEAQHRHLFSENQHSESRRLAETNMATLMLLVVVGVFLLVEVPLAVMMMIMIVENTFHPLLLMDPDARSTATLLVNLIIQFSYPVNFFIYCGMSQQFRQTFCQLFVGQAAALVLGTHTQPSRCPDVDDEGQDNDDANAAVESGDCEQVGVSSNVNQNGDTEVFNMATITHGQR